jgi:hypothetical protein
MVCGRVRFVHGERTGYAEETERWGKVILAAGIRAD